jgi:nitrate reductase alpha subunit
MKYGEATDLLGNKVTHRWDPRICQKGLALTRRFYGDRRVMGCMIRKGFKEWHDAGFPREGDGLPPRKYFNRGRDELLRITHDQGARIALPGVRGAIGEAESADSFELEIQRNLAKRETRCAVAAGEFSGSEEDMQASRELAAIRL